MQWEIHDQDDSRVIGSSQWLHLDHYKDLEHKCGVFLFADHERVIKYVGVARPFRMINEIYRVVRIDKDEGAELVKALYTSDLDDAESLQQYLIDKYQPHNNLV